MVTVISVHTPASASSIALSTTSKTRWCSPRTSVEPMYMPGRRRTASRPSSTVILLASYVSGETTASAFFLAILLHAPSLHPVPDAEKPVYPILVEHHGRGD